MASRYDGRGDAPTITRRRHVLACARCRARRVKCDRAQPTCSNCAKVGALCQPVQQSTPPHALIPSRTSSREPIEQNRLSKLEEEVARISREVESKSPSREPSLTPSPVEASESRAHIAQGRLLKGPVTSYLSPFSWAAAAEEVGEGPESFHSRNRLTYNRSSISMQCLRMIPPWSVNWSPLFRILQWAKAC